MSRFLALRRYDAPLAALLGAIATLGFAPLGWWPLSVLSLAGLFALVNACGPARSAWLGWLFATAHFLSGLYWIYISTALYGGAPWWLGALLTFALSGLYMAPWLALALALAASLRLWTRPIGWLALPALWLLAELARGHLIFGGFPWLSLGYVALDTPLRNFAPLLGVHGLSALLAVAAYALWRAWVTRGVPRVAALALLPVLALSAWLLPTPSAWTQAKGAPMKVAIIQADIPQEMKWLPEMQLPTLQSYAEMTLDAGDAQLIIWPEAALTQTYDMVKDSYLDPLGRQLAARGATLLAGLLIEEDAGQTYYNSVIALGAHSGRYDKRHLVPFGEYFPIPAWLRPVLDVLDTPFSDLSPSQTTHAPIVVDGRRLGIAICFEDVFADEFRNDARDATLLVSVTNDAWFGHSIAAAQHLQMARMRALETGRVILRASNTGVSAVIGPEGELQVRAGFFTRETLRASAQPRSGLTPYTRWGDTPLWWLAFAVLLAALWHRRMVASSR